MLIMCIFWPHLIGVKSSFCNAFITESRKKNEMHTKGNGTTQIQGNTSPQRKITPLSINRVMNSFNKHLSSTYFAPATRLGSKQTHQGTR